MSTVNAIKVCESLPGYYGFCNANFIINYFSRRFYHLAGGHQPIVTEKHIIPYLVSEKNCYIKFGTFLGYDLLCKLYYLNF